MSTNEHSRITMPTVRKQISPKPSGQASTKPPALRRGAKRGASLVKNSEPLDDPAPTPKRKKAQEDSEVLIDDEKKAAAQVIIPGRNFYESCEQWVYRRYQNIRRLTDTQTCSSAWPIAGNDSLVLTGCMHRCEICGVRSNAGQYSRPLTDMS